MAEWMRGRPYKFRMLELLYRGEDMWNYQIVEKMMDEYCLDSDYYRDSLNFDLVEVAASGFIISVDSDVDPDGTLFRKDALLSKYRITCLGKKQYECLADRISSRGGI
jgi:hypothetical protein